MQSVTLLNLDPTIEKEFSRIILDLQNVDAVIGYDCLSLEEVLRAHFLIANHFYIEQRNLGGIGPRDIGLLQSAVHRQGAGFAGKTKWGSKYDICATLFFGLIKNHPFHDANKRTAFLCVLYQLQKFDLTPTVTEKELEDFTVEIADNQLLKYKRYQELVKNNEADPEVKFISWYLRTNTRGIDKKQYTVTYRQLNSILRKFGYELDNPAGNYIDVYKVVMKKNLFGKDVVKKIRLGNIGFPGWKDQVRPFAIKKVRELTDLTPRKGVDSQSFFKNIETLDELITSYSEPLERLAMR